MVKRARSRLTYARFDNSVLHVEYFNNRIFRRTMKVYDLLSNESGIAEIFRVSPRTDGTTRAYNPINCDTDTTSFRNQPFTPLHFPRC